MHCSCGHTFSTEEREHGLIGVQRDATGIPALPHLAMTNCPCGSTCSFECDTAEADRIDAELRIRARVESIRLAHYAVQANECTAAVRNAKAATDMIFGALGLAQ